MKFHTIGAVLLAVSLGAGSAAAADKCSIPTAEWQSEQALRTKLEVAGWKIRAIKIDKGCYEVYGLDDKGNRAETYFDPKLLEALKANG